MEKLLLAKQSSSMFMVSFVSKSRLTFVQERCATVDTAPVAGIRRDRHGDREKRDDADDLHFVYV